MSPTHEIRYINGLKKKGAKLSPYQRWVLKGCPANFKGVPQSAPRPSTSSKRLLERIRGGPCPKTKGSVIRTAQLAYALVRAERAVIRAAVRFVRLFEGATFSKMPLRDSGLQTQVAKLLVVERSLKVLKAKK